MNIKDKFDNLIKDCKEKLNDDSAFETLLKVLVTYGMDEEKAAQMIADCIDEQYELDQISTKFADIYSEAKNDISPKDAILELHEQLVKSGMSDASADMLAAKFLEQEAQTYVDCMNLINEQEKKDTVLH